MSGNVIPFSERRAMKIVTEHKFHDDELDSEADMIIQQLLDMAEVNSTASIHKIDFGSSKELKLVINRILNKIESHIFGNFIFHPKLLIKQYLTK
ncbi:hypothetical protein RCC09_004598 [Vibrio parahaemolyticus]|nr:hypothetical protein [Vibrio parahaemolyticus]ELA6811928.1 hypothetical protein [Vibrio parahaemolyticus]ELA7299486.1 hypothetical protein [Vibrio parahaemolyticus]HAS6459799.1 hypothetical protein [Vibrio parahaemolyticus]HAS6470509.1 hypothetical protein [Vibrio parahaemolyticus]